MITCIFFKYQETVPIILLHGSCSNSAFWFPEIMTLSNNFRVYAVDIVGEAGNSEEYRPDLSSDAFALWMKDVLDALGLAQIRPQFLINADQTRQPIPPNISFRF